MIRTLVSLLNTAPGPQALGVIAKVTLLFLAGALLAAALRRCSAAVRHWVWALTLLAALGLPLLSAIGPVWVLTVTQPSSWSHLAPSTRRFSAEAVPDRSLTAVAPAVDAPSAGGATSSELANRGTSGVASLSIAGWVATLWVSGCVAVLLWTTLGHLGLARLSRRAAAIDSPGWRRLLGEAVHRCRARRPVRLCSSPGVGAPVTWGWRRPLVVLPAHSESWPEERRRVALEHELAHIERWDYLAQLGATLACAVYWFHPLAWIALRRLRAESEQACDDRVLASGTSGPDYAMHLLDVARGARVWWGGSVAVCMARPTQLEGRLLSLLDEARPRGLMSPRLRLLAASTAALALIPLAGMQPEVRATPAVAMRSQETAAMRSQETVTMRTGQDYVAKSGHGGKDADTSSADSTFEKTLPASPGELLTLDLDTGGEVELEGWSEPRVLVRVRLGGEDWQGTHVDIERDGRGVHVTSRQARGNGSYSTSHRFEIRAPRKYDLRLRSSGGSVTIVAMEGTFRGETGGGEITLDEVHGEVNISTGGGEISVTDADASGSVRTGGGTVQLSRVRGGLRASSGSGPVVYAEETSSGKGGKHFYVDLSGVEVDASGTHVEDARADATGLLTIEKAGGEVVLEEAPHGARITTGGGDVRVGRAAGLVEASTGGGDIELGPVAGSVIAGTGAGDVRVALASAPGQEQTVQIDSGTGTIVVELPADLDAAFDLETAYTREHTRTRIDSDWKLERQETKEWDDSQGTPRRYVRAQGVVGKGAGRIQVRTVNGNIVIRRVTTRSAGPHK